LRYCLAWDLSEYGSEYFFSFNHVSTFKVFGIFVNASLENAQQRKAWERCASFWRNENEINKLII
jgi:hypothetical protein